MARTTIINDDMAAEFFAVMGQRRACLLRGHGMTVAGASVEEATATSLTVYQLAHANYLAYAIGTPQEVPDLEDHRQRWATGRGRQRAGATNSSGEPFEWRYGKKLLRADSTSR